MSRLPRSPYGRALHGAALALALFLGVAGGGQALGAAVFDDTEDIEVGDCFNSRSDLKGLKTDETKKAPLSVDIVSCDDPHQSEAYAVLTVPDGPFPGDQKLASIANEKCGDKAIDAYVGAGRKLPDGIGQYFYLPSSETWATGDQEITCFLADPAHQTTGSLRAPQS
ncbi:hypothetical protein GCM10010302_59920 [Streptomyces polychromogenes]|uniref:Septum formation-related domain-containing protein n=1 Tax=Streptomyces polychromogenes TaxID=67342 RepID=A0ABP3FAC7_9ACTN